MNVEKHIIREEKKIEALEKKILKEEHEIIGSLGKLKLKQGHLLDFFKIVGGALIGTSFGAKIVGQTELVQSIPWINVIGIFVLSLVVGFAMVYKAEKDKLKKMKNPKTYLLLRLFYIWVIAAAIGGLSSSLFITEPLETLVFIKVVLVGSYPALAGAIGFNFI